tara:strand:- start:4840 stop:6222 length:1383 start_codon:yes stop_codon:yes gene_type:complete
MKINIGKTELIHFVGIGGIGMSGLALIMNSLGFKIQGSDVSDNKYMNSLRKRKIPIILKHSKQNIKNCTVLVVSSAIKKSNPEYKYAKKLNLPIYKRGELLGHLVSLMKNIVVTGSHGKTTTTSILSNILNCAKLDPTIINGGVINSIGSSAKLGKSDWSVVESDESDGSFLHIPFNYSIITNIDNEHLDYYKTLKNLKNKFIEFIDKTPSFGKAFLCSDDKNIKKILPKLKNNNYYTFGLNKNSNFHIFNIIQTKDYSKFCIKIKIPGKTKIINGIFIPLLGLHNIKNAASALAVAFSIGVSDKIIKKGLKNFKGVQRRFNYLFEINKVPFFDDYAHHPTEIESVLEGVRKVYSKEEIVCIFQPHRISRVKNLKNEFSKCFKKANTILLCPIYKAGENMKLGFSFNSFAKLIAKNSNVNLIILKNEMDLKKLVKNIAFGNKIFISMGAGSITNWVRELN